MDKFPENVAPGSNQSNMKKSYQRSVSSLLTAFPFEDFSRAFPKFNGAERDQLYQIYIQTIISLHENLQEAFDSLCHETKVGTVMNTVEHLVEQQSLDPLFSQKTNVKQVKNDLQAAKKKEIYMLEDMLDKAKNQKHSVKARIKLLRKTQEETSGATDAVGKLRSMLVKYVS